MMIDDGVKCVDKSLPQISLICGVFNVITNGFEHSARRGHQTTIKYLQTNNYTKKVLRCNLMSG